IAQGEQRDGTHMAQVRRRLLEVGDGLDWNGRLDHIDDWPADPLVRDIRFRLGAVRATAAARWPLERDRDSLDSVAADVEYLALQRAPLFDWPAASGWDDSARRLALRHHAGLLRVLQTMLQRGLSGGLVGVPSTTWDTWIEQLTLRRRECLDGLVTLRELGRLGWQADPPEWDGLFRAWRRLLLAGVQWTQPVPAQLQQLLTANVATVAAVAAETGWHAARGADEVAQSFTAVGVDSRPTLTIFTAVDPTPDDAAVPVNQVRLGLRGRREGRPEITLAWNVPALPAESTSGESVAPAPPQLVGH